MLPEVQVVREVLGDQRLVHEAPGAPAVQAFLELEHHLVDFVPVVQVDGLVQPLLTLQGSAQHLVQAEERRAHLLEAGSQVPRQVLHSAEQQLLRHERDVVVDVLVQRCGKAVQSAWRDFALSCKRLPKPCSALPSFP